MNNTNKKRQRLILILSVIVVLIIAVSGISLASYNGAKKLSKEWNDKIYPGVTVNGVDLTGKTLEEAKELINSQCTEKLLDKELKIVVGDKSFQYKYSSISAGYDIDKGAEEAINYGKDLGIFEQKKLIKNRDDSKKEFQLDFTYDEEKFAELEQKVKTEVNVEPKNAILHFNGGAFSITPEVAGYELNTEGINDKVKEAINGDLNKESVINLELIKKEPSITEDKLSKITGQMAYYETSFNKGYDTGRDYNLALAAAQVNGTVLMPGEVFSYSEKTKAVENQYKDAIVIGENNQYVPGNAGGICQVSTTLYNAVMRANIRSVERRNHSIASSYAPVGLDATVSWGYLDYKFKNTYDFPIYLYAAVVGNTVQAAVYGDPSAMGGKTYSMISEVDVRQAENKQIAKAYLITYENGQEVNREYIDTSTYILDNTPVSEKTETENNADAAKNNAAKNNTSENKVETSTPESADKKQETGQNTGAGTNQN